MKLNDENLNNYHQNKIKKVNKEIKKGVYNIESLIDIEDFLIFCSNDEKGNCKIIQTSASFAHFLGYKKIDIIGKPIEVILPNILTEEMHKFLENQIKLLHRGQTIQTEIDEQNDSNKNSIFIFMKTRNGYIYPFSSSYIFSDNNDYSDSSLIKIKIENKELRYEYSYYIVTNLDYVIENISSSAINLGLSLDLLKKYLVKIDILIRTEQDSNLNTEKYSEYEEEPKEITWVFPYMIYPKDIKKLNKEEEIENLITKSKKKKYNMQIKIIKINGNDNIAFLFKINEITQRNNKIKLNNDIFIPKSDKKMIMFYLTKLKYTRTYVVDKKTGFNNLIVKSQEENNDNTQIKENNKLEEKKIKNIKKVWK